MASAWPRDDERNHPMDLEIETTSHSICIAKMTAFNEWNSTAPQQDKEFVPKIILAPFK